MVVVARRPPIEPQCLDDETFVNCSAFASAARPYARIRCVRADCCDASDGRLLEQLLNYKWVAASRHIARTGGAAIVLDVDALVLSQACLDEWTSYPEPFVSQIGGAPGCPPYDYNRLGVGINSGAVLLRPAALPLVDGLLALRDEPAWRYKHHCFEQELLNAYVVRRATPRWLDFPQLLELGGAHGPSARVAGAKGTEGLRLRFLNFSRWPGGVRAARLGRRTEPASKVSWESWAPAADACIFHSVADGRLKAEKAWAARGLWHLPDVQ